MPPEKTTLKTHRKLDTKELFALTAANYFWSGFVEEHHDHEDGACVAAIDLDELEQELDVYLRKGLLKARKLKGKGETDPDNPFSAFLNAMGGDPQNHALNEAAADEDTWAMARSYVIAYVKIVLNARKE